MAKKFCSDQLGQPGGIAGCTKFGNAKCIIYTGANLNCTGILTNDSLDVVLNKLENILCTCCSGGNGGGGGSVCIEAGNGVTITGLGTPTNCYNISINPENIQDVVGLMFLDTPTIDFTYDDGAGKVSADLIVGAEDNTLTDIMVWNGTDVHTRTLDSISGDVINNFISNFNSSNYYTTSTDCIDIPTVHPTQITMTVGTGLAYVAGQTVIIYADAQHYFTATVVSYDAGTGILVIDSVSNVGIGNFCNWTVNLASLFGLSVVITEDTTTLDLTGDGTLANPLFGDVNVSQFPNNEILILPDGLYAPGSRNQLLEGGIVTWTGVGYIYDISPAVYFIGGVEYTSPGIQVTLDPSDPTLDRIDSFIVDITGNASVLTGTPSDNPQEPPLDPATQLRLSIAFVEAGTTTPTGAVIDCLYKENLEWTTSVSTSRINPNSTVSPFTGSKDVEGTSTITGDNILFTRPGGAFTPLTTFTTISFKLRVKTDWHIQQRKLSLRWELAGVPQGVVVNISDGFYGLNTADTVNYQIISIPLSNFGLNTLSSVDSFRITVNTNSPIGWFIDDICISNADISHQGSLRFQNWTWEDYNTSTVEFGSPTQSLHEGLFLNHDTYTNTGYFKKRWQGQTIYDYPHTFEQQQSFQNSTSLAGFLHAGDTLGQTGSGGTNNVRLGFNFTGAVYQDSTPGPFIEGYFGDRIGYSLGVNWVGHGSFGTYVDNLLSKTGGILIHTLDTSNTDAVTIYGTPPLGGGGPALNGNLKDYKTVIFHNNRDSQFLGKTYMDGGRFEEDRGVDITAANNLTLSIDGNLFVINGSTQINAILTADWQAGSTVKFIFAGTPTLKHNTVGGAGTAPMLLAGSIDFTTAVNDTIQFVYSGSFWHEIGRKLASSGGASVTADNGLIISSLNNVQLGSPNPLGAPLLHDTYVWGNTFNLDFISVASSSTVAIQNQNLVSGTALDANSDNGIGASIGSTNGLPAYIYSIKPGNSTVETVVRVDRLIGGGGSISGFGGKIEFRASCADTQSRTSNELVSKWTDTTVGTRTSDFVVTGVKNTVTSDLLTIHGDGQHQMNKYGIGTFLNSPIYLIGTMADGSLVETDPLSIGGILGVPIENSLFVAKNGNDGTGARTRLDLPYLTINGALADALAGDTIFVYPGTYEESAAIVLNSNINYNFLGKGVLQLNTGVTTAIFLDSGGSATVKIVAPGWTFEARTNQNVFNLTGTSNITFSADKLTAIGKPCIITTTGGSASLTGTFNSAQSTNGSITCIKQTHGTMVLDCGSIENNAGFGADNSALNILGSAIAYVKAQRIESIGALAQDYSVLGSSLTAASRVYIEADLIKSVNDWAIFPTASTPVAAEWHCKAKRIENTSDCTVVSGIGSFTVQADEIVNNSLDADIDGITHAEGGNLLLIGGKIIRTQPSLGVGRDVITSAGGTVRLIAMSYLRDRIFEETPGDIRRSDGHFQSDLTVYDGRFMWDKGANVTAANDLTLGGDGNLFTITGNTQINAIINTNWQAGSEVDFVFTGTPTLKHNTAGGAGTAKMLLAGSTDYTAAANDTIKFVYDGTVWHELGRKLASTGGAGVTADNGTIISSLNNVQLGSPTSFGAPLLHDTHIGSNGFVLTLEQATGTNGQMVIRNQESASTSIGTGLYVENRTQDPLASTLFSQNMGGGTALYAGQSGDQSSAQTAALRVESAASTGGTSVISYNTQLLYGPFGAPLNGNGVGIEFRSHTTVVNNNNAGSIMGNISHKWVDATHATRMAQFDLQASNQGTLNTIMSAYASGVVGIGISSGYTGTRLEVVDNAVGAASIIKVTSTSTAAATNLQKGIEVSLSGANSNSNQKTYGVYVSNTHTTNSPENYGVWATSSGFGAGVFGTSDYRGVRGSSTNASGVGVQGDASGSSGGIGVWAIGTSGAIGAQANSVDNIALAGIRIPSSTNSEIAVANLERLTSGTAANGIGGSIDLYLQNSAGSPVPTNQIAWVLTDVTAGSIDSKLIFRGYTNGVGGDWLTLASGGTLQLNQYGAGTLTTDGSGNVTATSDERLKNIQGNYTGGVAEIEKIVPIEYKWNEKSGFDQEGKYIGFSAQNIQEALGDDAVGKNSEGYLTIQDRAIIATLVNVVKEQQKQIEELRQLLNK